MLSALEFLIPPGLMESREDKKRLTWSTDAGLVALDMEIEGGLSVSADEEDEND
jgi:hypothetical protein